VVFELDEVRAGCLAIEEHGVVAVCVHSERLLGVRRRTGATRPAVSQARTDRGELSPLADGVGVEVDQVWKFSP
jgi:hypothetical protein